MNRLSCLKTVRAVSGVPCIPVRKSGCKFSERVPGDLKAVLLQCLVAFGGVEGLNLKVNEGQCMEVRGLFDKRLRYHEPPGSCAIQCKPAVATRRRQLAPHRQNAIAVGQQGQKRLASGRPNIRPVILLTIDHGRHQMRHAAISPKGIKHFSPTVRPVGHMTSRRPSRIIGLFPSRKVCCH